MPRWTFSLQWPLEAVVRTHEETMYGERLFTHVRMDVRLTGVQ
jgi:hypothetical protein